MPLEPSRLERIKLQRPMPCWTMLALEYVANVDARVSYGSGCKAD